MGNRSGRDLGATGGVMEAALRTAYFTLKGENPPADAFRAVRSEGFQENAGVQEAEFEIGDIKLRTAAVSGLEIHGDCCSRSSAGKSTTTLSKSWHARAAASAAADSRSTTARSGRLREAESSMRWTQSKIALLP